MTNPKNVKTTELAALVLAIADPEQEVSAITKKSLEDFNVSAVTVEGIKKISDAVYSDIAAMVMLRESKGTAEEDIPALKAAEEKARKSMAAWFYGLGSRDPNKKDGKRRPLYSVTVPDLVLMGEVSADARADADGDASKISDCFLKYLIFETARILNGQPLARISANDFKKARKAANDAKAKKAADTKAANEKKAADKAAEEKKAADEAKAKDDKIAQLEKKVADYEAHSIDIVAVVTLVNKSHATQEEKQAILDALYGRTKKAEEAKAEDKQ